MLHVDFSEFHLFFVHTIPDQVAFTFFRILEAVREFGVSDSPTLIYPYRFKR
uniref:Uncharacterized protein n=1 Tax=Arundo donax TaxID=35708 RepID=A0A0A9D1B2_ARUDO